MTLSKQHEAILAVIADVTKHDVAGIKPEMDLVADLGVDSPKALELLVEIEERLGIEISDDEAEALDTVGDILRFVDRGDGQ